MSVGSGYQDLIEPGGEHPGAGENVPLTAVVFGTPDGSICLLGSEYASDGAEIRGTIGIPEMDPVGNLRIPTSGVVWDLSRSYKGLWLVFLDGPWADVWILLDDIDALKGYLFVAAATLGAPWGAEEGDKFSIGEIRAYRDFSVARPPGSVQFDSMLVDHEGADGVDSAAGKALLFIQTFSQGLRPADPLTRISRAACDEQAIGSSRKWLRIEHARSARGRVRMEAHVSNRSVRLRQVRLRGKEWPR